MIKTNTSKEEKTFDDDVKLWIEETKTPRYTYITEHLLNILKNLNLRNKNILELECGISPYLKHLSNNRCYGLDVSKKLLEMNKCKNAKFVHGDLLKCSKYFNKKFNLVFMAGVMHHVNEKDHEIALKEISKILKRNGKLIIVEPNMISITGFFYILRKTAERILPKKILKGIIGFSSEEERYVFPSRFAKLLKKNRFKILDEHSIGLIRMPPLVFLRNTSVERFNKKLDFFLRKFKINIGTTIVFISEKRGDNRLKW